MIQDKFIEMPNEKGCIPQEMMIQNVQLAHAYVPFQKMCTTMTPMRSLMAGTAFPELEDYYWNVAAM